MTTSNVVNLYIDDITAVDSFIDLDLMTLELIGTNDINPYTYIDSF